MAVPNPTIVNFSADSGTLGDGITDADVVTVWGTAAPNTTLSLYDGKVLLGTTTVSSSGSWTLETPKLADGDHSLTATATDSSGNTSASSAVMSVNVVPSVTHFVTGTDNWSNPTIIDGQGWYNDNAGKSWSLTTPDSHTVRMEVRAGDYWVEDGSSSSRSEILAANSVSNGGIFNASYSMTVEPGTSNVNSGLSWLSLAQMYGANGATFSIQLQGEQMAVVVNLNEADQQQVYKDPNPIQRGQAYDIQIQARFAPDSTGYLEIWRDGVQIVDYHGILGDAGANYNLKLGIYRGDPSAANYTMAADYSNIVTSTDPNFPTPPFSGSGSSTPSVPAPTTSSSSNDGAVVGDGSTTIASNGSASAPSQSLPLTIDTTAPAAPVINSSSPQVGQPSVLTLTGSAEANSDVKVFDGKNFLGSAATDGNGAWSFTTGDLANTTHPFTATATDAAGNSSGPSTALSVTVAAPSVIPTVSPPDLNSVVVADNGGNAANLTGVIANPAGIPQAHADTPLSGGHRHHSFSHLGTVADIQNGFVSPQSAAGQVSTQPLDSTSSSSGSNSLAAMDKVLALLAQHMASAFPSSPFGHGSPLLGSTDETSSQQLAKPIASHHHTLGPGST